MPRLQAAAGPALLGGFLVLAACGTTQVPGSAPLAATYDRTYEKTFQEAPFALGPMAVLATEGGELQTWRLVPCRGRTTVCAGGPEGPAGQVRATPDWLLVTGLYGRSFWLSYAGDGYVQRGGVLTPLAWNALPNGTGEGTQAAMETEAPHAQDVIAEVAAAQ